MKILGIESCCDDTAAAVLENGKTVLSSLVSSQTDIHATWGGVIPEIAAREHLKTIAPVVDQALADASVELKDIDAIAVTQGPGLIGSLLVGICYAKGLAQSSKKPLIPVDHVHGHIFGALLGAEGDPEDLFPCLALVASGGHSNLYYMKDPLTLKLMAYSIDDACGESFDKVGKKIGISYPGGPVIERLARGGDKNRFDMPVIMAEKARMKFSYSGLKTHMINTMRKIEGELTEKDRQDLCASFQHTALEQLVRKIKTATTMRPDVKSVVISGGVSANQYFKDLMREQIKIPALFPPLKFCADNAAMIASYAFYKNKFLKPDFHESFFDYSWDAYSQYKYEEVL